ncbi:hypothetical protein PIB30_018608 [Stylosanthes scabra]|uniref:Pentatricopeptide repeat-containing protein n=1 Tax=Stylosanthes scabra TaxID=79078 RepID=A0ABU6S8M7_9FABA|nr:hypothetical protein [Stylosanthes scabra]
MFWSSGKYKRWSSSASSGSVRLGYDNRLVNVCVFALLSDGLLKIGIRRDNRKALRGPTRMNKVGLVALSVLRIHGLGILIPYIIRLFRYRFKLGKLAKRSFGFFESSISASSSLPLWLCRELDLFEFPYFKTYCRALILGLINSDIEADYFLKMGIQMNCNGFVN